MRKIYYIQVIDRKDHSAFCCALYVLEKYNWAYHEKSETLCSHIHEMHVGKLRIGVTMHVALNLCREWRFNSVKHFHLSNTTASPTASMLHFRIYISIRNLLTKILFICIYIYDVYNFETHMCYKIGNKGCLRRCKSIYN